MIKDALKITEIHLDRLVKAEKEIRRFKNIDNIDFDDFENIKLIDAFVFRFMKLQDYMGDKVFKVFLAATGDYKDSMSFVDVLDKLEKLGVIDSTEEWLKIRQLRNKLAHDYPDELDEIKQDIEEALTKIELLQETYKKIKSFLKERKLLRDLK